jgi:hypothetical protein
MSTNYDPQHPPPPGQGYYSGQPRGDIAATMMDQFLRAIPSIISRVRASQATTRNLTTNHTIQDDTVKRHHQQRMISTLQTNSRPTTRRRLSRSGIVHMALERLTTPQ